MQGLSGGLAGISLVVCVFFEKNGLKLYVHYTAHLANRMHDKSGVGATVAKDACSSALIARA